LRSRELKLIGDGIGIQADLGHALGIPQANIEEGRAGIGVYSNAEGTGVRLDGNDLLEVAVL